MVAILHSSGQSRRLVRPVATSFQKSCALPPFAPLYAGVQSGSWSGHQKLVATGLRDTPLVTLVCPPSGRFGVRDETMALHFVHSLFLQICFGPSSLGTEPLNRRQRCITDSTHAVTAGTGDGAAGTAARVQRERGLGAPLPLLGQASAL